MIILKKFLDKVEPAHLDLQTIHFADRTLWKMRIKVKVKILKANCIGLWIFSCLSDHSLVCTECWGQLMDRKPAIRQCQDLLSIIHQIFISKFSNEQWETRWKAFGLHYQYSDTLRTIMGCCNVKRCSNLSLTSLKIHKYKEKFKETGLGRIN